MTTILGTSGNDTLIGTGNDMLIGALGADTYLPKGSSVTRSYVIADQGGDTAKDVLDVSLYYGRRYIELDSLSPSEYDGLDLGGRAGWALLERVGDDLVMVLPAKPSAFRVTGHASIDVLVQGQYTTAGQIEVLRWGARDFVFATGSTGTNLGEVFAGGAGNEVFSMGAGDNIAWLNAGDDMVSGGNGNDIVFGGAGQDKLSLGAGANLAYGGADNDQITSTSGDDRLLGGAGNDRLTAGSGNDTLDGELNNDRLFGGTGTDQLTGGDGNDVLTGGPGGDFYDFDDAKASAPLGWGQDVINDLGDGLDDTVRLQGFSGPGYTGAPAISRIEISRVGGDAIFSIDEGAMGFTIKNQFTTNGAMDVLYFFNGYWTPWTMSIVSVDRDPVGDERPGGQGNEVIFGSNLADAVYSDAGINLIWLGAGADTLIYKESDPSTAGYSSGGGAVSDVVCDFDLTQDVMDFTEIKTLAFADLTITDGTDGTTLITWSSGTIDVSDILISLRNVASAELTADNFLFF